MADANQRFLTKIEGPPGSGKSRSLAREACRLIVEEGIPPGQILLLAITPGNQKQLKTYLSLEASLAGRPEAVHCPVLTLHQFLKSCLQHAGLHELHILKDEEINWLSLGLLRQNPIFPSQNTALFKHTFVQNVSTLLQELTHHHINPEQLDNKLQETGSLWISQLYLKWTQLLQQNQWVLPFELAERLSQTAPFSLPYQAILADEVQEWSQTQHHFFLQLPVRWYLTGQAALSIRNHWQASPQSFASLQAEPHRPITHIQHQACMRGNAPILSVLNHFLPTPIWEEQQPDLERLSMLQFTSHADPQTEAQQIIAKLEQWKTQAFVNDRPATWNDCAILLRSKQYQSDIMNALLQADIPFMLSPYSDESQQMQRSLLDLFQGVNALQHLGLQRQQVSPETTQLIMSRPLTQIELTHGVETANRHLKRWMEAQLSEAQILPISDEQELLLNTWLTTPQDDIRLLATQLSDGYITLLNQNLLAFLDKLTPLLTEQYNTELLQEWTTFKEQVAHRHSQLQSTFQDNMLLSDCIEQFSALWPTTPNRDNTPKVRILSLQQAQSEEFAFVAIPFMVASEFPRFRSESHLLEDSLLGELGILSRDHKADEKRLLAMAMSRATQQLWLSTHQSDSGERENPILISPFFEALYQVKQNLLESNQRQQSFTEREITPVESSPHTRYFGKSKWAQSTTNIEEPIYHSEQVLSLSASSIKTYMTCPKQFYYRHLLRLPQPDSATATLGTIIHKVMEVFNKKAQPANYTAEHLKSIAHIFFDFQQNPEAFSELGFNDRDRRNLEGLNLIGLSELKQRLLDSIDDLERKGYFSEYRHFQKIEAEKALDFSIEGIERCQFSGKLDALIQKENGTWDILDYKTFRSAYGKNVELCEREFFETLATLSSDDNLSATERFADKLDSSYPKDYQLPLYYLACQEQPQYANQLHQVALQLLRPAFPDNPAQGAIRLSLTAEAIEAAKADLIHDLNQYIVNPILQTQTFSATPAESACDYCAYTTICDLKSAEDAE